MVDHDCLEDNYIGEYNHCKVCNRDCSEDLVWKEEKRHDEGLIVTHLDDDEECTHDDIDGGYCIDCEAPIQDFMDCDYYKDRQDDY